MSELLTVKQVEAIAERLRKYRLSPADALSVSKALVHAVDSPLPVQAADLASLMRPRRQAPERDPAVAERRADMRLRLASFHLEPGRAFVLQHHPADDAAVRSAVQYLARKAGLKHSVTRMDDRNVLITLTTER